MAYQISLPSAVTPCPLLPELLRTLEYTRALNMPLLAVI